MQLGFVIDQSRCIGCHACTVACKSENDVPVGKFRTWVKYTEEGQFPSVRRSFAVLRCNQCSNPPCVTICPVGALEKRAADGVIDVDPAACFGCKACMQGCPYDALYLNEESGTAQKCHFCVHRQEQGLAPACAVVCPTEAIIPGDFDDPGSVVSRMRDGETLSARKVEAGTRPNVLYRDAAPAGLDPLQTNSAGGYLWADRVPTPQIEAAEHEALERRAEARTTYDVQHPPLWGEHISGYLFTKSLAAGLFLAPLTIALELEGALRWFLPLAALAFLGWTMLLLVLDLGRPERFFFLLTRPNPRSWLVRGTWALTAYGAVLALWLWLGGGGGVPLAVAGAGAAALSACYTGWLFGQAKGRVLWMRRGLWLHLIVQAFLAGAAGILALQPALQLSEAAFGSLTTLLVVSLVGHLGFLLTEGLCSPKGREKEYARAHGLVTHGPYATQHWRAGVLLGVVLPLLLLCLPGLGAFAVPVAAVLALIGLYAEEDVLVRAGQALSIS